MIQDRMNATENHLGQICDTMSSYTRKTAHVRDKGDDIAKTMARYADYETINITLKKALAEFAENFSAVQDYRQAEVTRLEAKVVEPLTSYGLLCKQTKNELKASFASRDKEINQRKKVDKVRQKNPSDAHQITQAERELQKASVEATRTEKILEQQMDTFEKNKVEDMKKILRNFVNIEMMFHAKALELYTKCFQSLNEIDPAKDVEEFKQKVHPSDNTSSRMIMAKSASDASMQSNRTPSGQTTPGSQRSAGSQNSQQSSKLNFQQNSQQNSQQNFQQNSPSQTTSSTQQNIPTQKSSNTQQRNTPAQSPMNSQRPSPAHTPIKVQSKVNVLEDDSEDDDDDDYDDDDDDYDDETTEASTARTGSIRK
ncbi:protein FAM92A-B-like isoform X2 [Gigantopelta aegis]|nr:protein FAM92A-B-like isoform X2 [Gigantopelta aegis]